MGAAVLPIVDAIARESDDAEREAEAEVEVEEEAEEEELEGVLSNRSSRDLCAAMLGGRCPGNLCAALHVR